MKRKIIIIIFSFVLVVASVFSSVPSRASGKAGVYSEVKISAAGDCTLGTDSNFSYGTSLPAKYSEVGDPAYFFSGVLPIFSEDDITIVNMEGTLTDRGARADKTYAFRGDPSYTEILTSGSVEATNLANNHSKDYGEVSYEDTIMYLQQAGITTFGRESVNVMDIDGVRVGLVGVYELPYGISCKDTLINDINKVKAEGANIIIASFHWGTEREYYPDSIQQDLAHTAIDNGVDLVLGHHPHVLQGIEKYKGKYIAYSLGNFCFGGNKNPSDKDTMIITQAFKFYDGQLFDDQSPRGIARERSIIHKEASQDIFGEMQGDNVRVIPCRLSSSTNVNDYRPVPFEGDDSERVFSRLREYSAPYYR